MGSLRRICRSAQHNFALRWPAPRARRRLRPLGDVAHRERHRDQQVADAHLRACGRRGQEAGEHPHHHRRLRVARLQCPEHRQGLPSHALRARRCRSTGRGLIWQGRREGEASGCPCQCVRRLRRSNERMNDSDD